MKSATRLLLALTIAGVSAPSFAAPEISGNVNVTNNRASKIQSGGAKGSVGIGPLKGGSVDAAGETNVNSLIVKDGKVTGTVNISGNQADDVANWGGGSVNVNSVVLGK